MATLFAFLVHRYAGYCDAPGTIPREGCTAAEEGVSITSTFPNVHADPKCKKSINWFVPKHDIYSPSSL